MDEFLKIVFEAHVEQSDVADKSYNEFCKPFLYRLQELVSEKLFTELEELFTRCNIDNINFYGVEGMKIAIDILEKKYIAVR